MSTTKGLLRWIVSMSRSRWNRGKTFGVGLINSLTATVFPDQLSMARYTLAKPPEAMNSICVNLWVSMFFSSPIRPHPLQPSIRRTDLMAVAEGLQQVFHAQRTPDSHQP